MSFSSLGIGSGLDLNALLDATIAVQGSSKQRALDRQEADVTADLSALGTLKSAISEFKTSIDSLTKVADFKARKASSSDEDVLTVSADTTAATGSHTVEVNSLAAKQVLATDAFAETTTPVGTGRITFEFGKFDLGVFTPNADRPSKSVTITASENSVQGISDAINDANVGVTASVVNDGSGERLVFTSNYTGTENSLKITVSDDDGIDTDTNGLSQIAYDPEAAVGLGKNISETKAATDASIVFDGILITKSENTFSDVIKGVSFTLNQDDPGVEKKINISLDTASVRAKVYAFRDSFNTLVDGINTLTSYNPTTNEAAALAGDFTTRAVDTKIHSFLTEIVPGIDGDIRSIADLGFETQLSGTVTLDDARLSKVINEDFEAIGALFARDGSPSDGLISFEKASESTVAGEYGVSITQIATQGTLVGSAAANLTITAGVNDRINLEIDGTQGAIILDPGTYSDADELASHISSLINDLKDFSKEGISVTVSADAGGILTVTSSKYGSESAVDVYGGNGMNDAFGGASVATTGVNVAGKIGSASATGNGQILTGGGDAVGLQIKVDGGPIGSRGTIAFSNGISGSISDYLESVIGSKGSLTNRINLANEKLDDIDDERIDLADYLAKVEERLVQQFSGLDSLIAQLNSQASFLAGALANLPSPRRGGGDS